MFSCIKTYRVEYAHQLWSSYTSLCHETIHGHSGKIEIQFTRNDGGIDEDSMVIDFGKISAIVKDHIMKKYDHALFMPRQFPRKYLDCLKPFNKRFTITDENPTAENFAKWIYEECTEILRKNGFTTIKIDSVVFHETETGCAMYSPYSDTQNNQNTKSYDWEITYAPTGNRTFYNKKKPRNFKNRKFKK